MKQQFEDLKTLVTSSKKVQVILIGLMLTLVLFFFLSGSPKKSTKLAGKQKNNEDKQVKLGKNTADEATKDLLQRFRADFDELRKENKTSKEELEQIRKGQIEYEQRTAEIFKKMLERMQENGGTTTNNSSSVPAPVELGGEQGLGGIGDQTNQQQDATLEAFGPLNEPEVGPPPPPAAKKIAYVGAGDSVRVKLLAGVNAPTDGSPYPVVFSLNGDVAGPDGSRLPLGEARLIAAAQGSLTDSRALFRLTSMNIRLPNGERKVINVDGWIVGEDGIRGMQGVLIDPIGKAIGGAAIAGGLAGYGTGLQSARSRVRTGVGGFFGLNEEIIQNTGEFAAGGALSAGAREWSSIIKERLNQMVPVVQVLSNREATAVFAKSVQIENLFEQYGEDSTDSSLD